MGTHNAQTLQCEMKFAVYLPNNPENRPLGVIYWLSGLTCTEQNFITKSGFQRYAAEHQVIVVAPILALAESKCRMMRLTI